MEADPQRRVRLNISNKLLEDMHPADLADIVEHLGHEDRTAIINAVDTETAAEMFSEVDPEIQTSIIESLKADKAADILEEMEPSEAADVLNELEDEQSEQILDEMEPEEKEDVEELLEFGENTAGGLMDTGFLSLPEDATVAQAMEALKIQKKSSKTCTTYSWWTPKITCALPSRSQIIFCPRRCPTQRICQRTSALDSSRFKAESSRGVF